MPRERLYLFDTTLRDGAQTTGVDFSLEDKRLIARTLDEIGIDYVEGGYPGGGYGPGGYGAGGYGAGGYGAGAYCGDGCGPATVVPEGMMVPEGGYDPGGYTPVEGMPMEGELYESVQPPAGTQQQLPPEASATPDAVNFSDSPKLPPLPGHTQSTTVPTSGSNQPANLGLIDPFRRQVRTGQTQVDVRSQRIQVKPTAQQTGHSTQTSGQAESQRNVAQTGTQASSPWSR